MRLSKYAGVLLALPLLLGAAQRSGTVSPNMWQRVVATSDTSNSSTAAATDIAGLSFAAASGKKYLVRGVLFVYAAASTTGLGVSAKATGAPTTSETFYVHQHEGASGNPSSTKYGAFVDTPVAFPDTNSVTPGNPQADYFEGYFVTTGTGTFQLRLVTEVDTSAVTIKAGSYLEWIQF